MQRLRDSCSMLQITWHHTHTFSHPQAGFINFDKDKESFGHWLSICLRQAIISPAVQRREDMANPDGIVINIKDSTQLFRKHVSAKRYAVASAMRAAMLGAIRDEYRDSQNDRYTRRSFACTVCEKNKHQAH